jgi:hypothetical protein
MTEAELIVWVGKNWPSLVLVLSMSALYVRLQRFIEAQHRDSRRIVRLMKVCEKQHPEKGAELWRDEEE